MPTSRRRLESRVALAVSHAFHVSALPQIVTFGLVHLASKIGRDPGERAERMQRYQERRPAQPTSGDEAEHPHEDDDEE